MCTNWECPNCDTVVGKSHHKRWCDELTWKKGKNLCGKCRKEEEQ